jgi:hypothetical protein
MPAPLLHYRLGYGPCGGLVQAGLVILNYRIKLNFLNIAQRLVPVYPVHPAVASLGKRIRRQKKSDNKDKTSYESASGQVPKCLKKLGYFDIPHNKTDWVIDFLGLAAVKFFFVPIEPDFVKRTEATRTRTTACKIGLDASGRAP